MSREIKPLIEFKFVIEGTYSADLTTAMEEYGTEDPVEMALVDLQEDPEEILKWATGVTMSIEPVT